MAAESSDTQQSMDAGESGFRVSDPEEYNQNARLRTVNQTRERVAETIEQSMARMVTDGEFTEADRQQVIRAAMYSYLTNLEWLMVEAQETELLREQELGEVVIEPPEEFVNLANSQNQGYPKVISSDGLEPYRETIRGIQSYLAAPDVFEATWTIHVEYQHSKPKTISQTKETHMPVHVSKNAFRIANQFLNRAGIDIDLKEDEGDAGFDYSDLLADGPPGARSAPEIEADGGEPPAEKETEEQ